MITEWMLFKHFLGIHTWVDKKGDYAEWFHKLDVHNAELAYVLECKVCEKIKLRVKFDKVG